MKHSTAYSARPAALAWIAFALASAGCEREERRFRETPSGKTTIGVTTATSLMPGPRASTLPANPARDLDANVAVPGSPYQYNAHALGEGKALFTQFNCVGCHGNGGGGMGPPLMDAKWIYGGEPEQIFSSIVQGRPNGMPAWRGRLTDTQVWRLVAYVRSMSGQSPKDASPGRDDHMFGRESEQRLDELEPAQASTPPTR